MRMGVLRYSLRLVKCVGHGGTQLYQGMVMLIMEVVLLSTINEIIATTQVHGFVAGYTEHTEQTGAVYGFTGFLVKDTIWQAGTTTVDANYPTATSGFDNQALSTVIGELQEHFAKYPGERNTLIDYFMKCAQVSIIDDPYSGATDPFVNLPPKESVWEQPQYLLTLGPFDALPTQYFYSINKLGGYDYDEIYDMIMLGDPRFAQWSGGGTNDANASYNAWDTRDTSIELLKNTTSGVIEIRRNSFPTRTVAFDTEATKYCVEINKTPQFVYTNGWKIEIEETTVVGENGGQLYNVLKLEDIDNLDGKLANGSKIYHEDYRNFCVVGNKDLAHLRYFAYNTTKGVRTLSRIPVLSEFVTPVYNAKLTENGEPVTAVFIDTVKMERNNTENWEPTVYCDAMSVKQATTGPFVGRWFNNNIPSAIEELVTEPLYDQNINGSFGQQLYSTSTNFVYPNDYYYDNVFFTYRESGSTTQDLVGELAFQGRLGVWFRDGNIRQTYLSREFSATRTWDSSVLLDVPVINHTPVEDLATRFIFKWRESNEQVGDANECIMTIRDNESIEITDSNTQTYDFYALHSKHLVHKSAVFWALRLGLPWEIWSVKVPITELDIDLYDVVSIVYNGELIKGEVVSITFDAQNKYLDVDLWTPRFIGSNGTFKWAWPTQVDNEDNYSNIFRGSESDGNTII